MSDDYVHFRIAGITRACKGTRTFRLESRGRRLSPKPGQYAIFWIPGVSENPFSFSGEDEITVREVCEDDEPGKSFTNRLFQMGEGDSLLARGPYGRPFPVEDKETNDYQDVIIAGGCGSAPMKLLAEKLAGRKARSQKRQPLKVLLGATSSDGLLFLGEYRQLADSMTVYTDDGSQGNKGMVTDGIRGMHFDGETRVYVCGPEKMMDVAAKTAVEAGAGAKHVYLSLERYMKCGMGLCGSCDCGGYLVCKKGPVFSYDELTGNPHFGSVRRARSGALERI